METETRELKQHNLMFDIRRSIRYHHRRRAFFDRLDQGTNMISVVFGSAAIYGVMESSYKPMALLSAGFVTLMSAINLVLASSQKARAHSDFARQFIELEKQLCDQVDEATLLEITRSRLTIEAEEPPVLQVLDVICHNEQKRAMGYPKEEMTDIRWWQRLFAQVIDLREDLLQTPLPLSKPD